MDGTKEIAIRAPFGTANRDLALILVWFVLLALLIYLSAIAIWLQKGGWDPAIIVENHLGSEAMLALYPDAEDRFRPARSLSGLIKITYPHLLSYGLLGFTLLHLLRSIAGHRNSVRLLTYAWIGISVLELISPYLFFFLPVLIATYIRLLSFTLFICIGIISCMALGWICFTFSRTIGTVDNPSEG